MPVARSDQEWGEVVFVVTIDTSASGEEKRSYTYRGRYISTENICTSRFMIVVLNLALEISAYIVRFRVYMYSTCTCMWLFV